MSGSRKQLRAVLLTFVMVTSMVAVGVAGFAGSASATVTQNGDVGDIAGDSSSTSQFIVDSSDDDDGSADADEIVLTPVGGAGSSTAVKIPLTPLTERGVDISNADVNIDLDETASDSVDVTRVENGEIRLLLTDSDGAGGGDDTIIIESLELTNIDTSNIDTASGISYLIQQDSSNNGAFDSEFTVDSTLETGTFSIATIEVENLATGEQTSVSSMSAALTQANNPDGGTAGFSGNPGDTVEIRPDGGTFTFDTGGAAVPAISDANTRIVPLDGADVTFENNDGGPTLDVNAAGVEVQNISFDQSGNAQNAIDVQNDAGLTVSESSFSNGGATTYVTTTDDATVNIQSSTFEDTDSSASGLTVTQGPTPDEGDITVSNNEFSGLATAIDVSVNLAAGGVNNDGLDAFSTSNNTFAAGTNVHVNDAADNGQVDLDAIFQNNEFEEFVITEDTNGDIATTGSHAILGDLDQATGATINNQDFTTIVSTGDHSLTNGGVDTIPLRSDGITIRAADGADVSNVTVDVGDTAFDYDAVSGVTITGITFDVAANSLFADVASTTGGGTVTDLTITDNRIVNIQGAGNVIDLAQGTADELEGGDISGNVFEASADAGNAYTAINIPDIDETGTSAISVQIQNNAINGTNSGGISVGEIDGGVGANGANNADNEIQLTILNNDIELTDATAGISAGELDSNDAVDVSITQNTIVGNNAGAGTGIDVGASGSATVEVANNDISNLEADGGIGIDALDFGQSGLTVQNNVLDNNGQHIEFTGSQEADTLRSNNQLVQVVEVLDAEDGSLVHNRIHGTIGAAMPDTDAGEFVAVGPSSYDESQVNPGATSVTIASTDGAAATTVTPADGNPIFNPASDGVTVRGFTIDSSAATVAASDVLLEPGETGGNDDVVTFRDSVFTGTTDRTAVEVDGTGAVNLENNEIDGYGTGVQIDGNDETTVNVLENQITNNDLGVDVDDGADDANINFNDIVGNNVGLENDEGDDVVVARGNWWGDTTGPSGAEFNGNGDEIAGGTDGQLADGTEVEPWQSESITNLPTDQYVVITDPRSPIANLGANANDEPNAEVLVTVLNDTVAGNTDQASTRVLADNSEPLRGIGQPGTATDSGGSGTAEDPFFFNSVESSTAGDFTLTARDVDGNVPRGSAVQPFSGTPSDVNVTVERGTLLADGSTTVNATVQVVDANGNPVTSQGDAITFLVDGASDAGVTRVTEEANTDANGQARLEVAADTAGVTLDITAVYDSDGYSDSGTVETVNEQLNIAVSPETITAGNSTEVSVNVSSAASGDAVENADVDLSGAGVSQILLTDADGTATATVNASSAGTIDVNVTADGFEDATATITVEEDAPAYYTLKLSNSIADRDVHAAIISIFSTHRQSGSTALLPHSVYRYTRTHTGGQR